MPTVSNVTTKNRILRGDDDINLAYVLNSTLASEHSNFDIRLARGRTPFLIIKHVPTNTTGKLYPSGKFTTIGSKSVNGAMDGYYSIREFIANEGQVPVDADEFSVTSIMAKVTTPFRINLDKLARDNMSVMFECELCANATVRRITVPDTTATVSANGKVNITASNQSATIQHLNDAWSVLRPMLENARAFE